MSERDKPSASRSRSRSSARARSGNPSEGVVATSRGSSLSTGSVEPVETLKDESIAVQRELRIEQVQLSLERLVVGRGFSSQPQMKR